MRILFVCRYNRFRSRIAEAYFKKINKNKSIKIDSAGAIKGRPVDSNQKRIAKQFGLNINGKTKALSTKLLKSSDVIINVADNVPLDLFNDAKKAKIINWKIKDGKESDSKKVREIIKKIIFQINKLNEQLENKK